MRKQNPKLPTFSPRVSTVLGNIDVVRETYRICEEGELDKELERFTKDLAQYLLEAVPGLKSWREPETKGRCVYLRPRDGWWIKGHDDVAILVDLGKVTNSDPSYGDGYVGVCAPKSWSKLGDFTELLRKRKPRGFLHIQDVDGEYDPEVPLWAYLSYPDFAPRGSFDTKAFVARIARHTKTLVDMKPQIERMIQQVKGR